MTFRTFWLVLALACLARGKKRRVLFVGDSFTYVNHLPEQVAHIAASLGDELIFTTKRHSGCTLWRQFRERKSRRYMEREWDFIVLQEHSLMATVQEAREKYMYPAIRSYKRLADDAKVVLYMTYSFRDDIKAQGYGYRCPSTYNEGKTLCFPKGSYMDLMQPPCENSSLYEQKTKNFACMGYSLTRGYLEAKRRGDADLVAPCGLAWQVAHGSPELDPGCKALIDKEYGDEGKFALPLRPTNLLETLPSRGIGRRLLQHLRHHHVDRHPSVAGQYLNALVMYYTLFGKSPIGAAKPLSSHDDDQVALSEEEVRALQHVARAAVEQCGAACGFRSSTKSKHPHADGAQQRPRWRRYLSRVDADSSL